MGEADCLITGDRDLLEMSSFHDIPILTPGWLSGSPGTLITALGSVRFGEAPLLHSIQDVGK